MKQLLFVSGLAHHFDRFVVLRRSQGAKYHTQKKVLCYFDRFLSQQHFHGPWPTREIIERYRVSLGHLHSGTRINRLSVVRQFCLYLRAFEPHAYIPGPWHPTGATPSRKPYIFTEGEIRMLLTTAHHLPPLGSLRPQTFYTLFGLLYTTGLRHGEAIALNLADADLHQKRLLVRNSKFGKSRWVPLSSSTCRVLHCYIQKRIRMFSATRHDPLFVNLHGRRFSHQIVYTAFRQVLSRCGLRGKGKGAPGPRIHDLRHSYACARLLTWHRQGRDVNTLLPALATYLGHRCITYTQVYLRATAELLEVAHQRFHRNFHEHVLPKGGPR